MAGPAPKIIVRHAVRLPRRLAGRVWYTLSAGLDAKPEELIAAALRHAQRARRAPVCVAASFPLSVPEIAALAGRSVVNGIVGKHRPETVVSLRREIPNANLGSYWEPGAWSLPDDALHVYFIGSWRLVTPAMLREAVRRQVLTLTVRCGRSWVDVPLGTVGRIARSRAALWSRAKQWSARLHPREPQMLAAPPRLDAQPVAAMIAAAAERRPPAFVRGRVVLVCGNLQPGGAERQVAYTARGLADRPGVESVRLICDMLTPGHPARYDFYLPLVRGAGIEARAVARRAADRASVRGPAALVRCGAALPEGLLVDVANLYEEFIAARPEVVHAWLDWSNTRAGLAAALAGVPRIVLSGRNLAPTNFALYQPYMDPIYEALCALPNVVFLNNSQAGAESYRRWLNLAPDRIKVIYNGIELDPVDTAAAQQQRTRLGIPAAAPLVGGIFRLYPEKRPLLWVETAARVLAANPEAWFVMFGSGILAAEIKEAANRLGIGERLIMPGITAEVLPAMRAFDVFLLTSYGEGVPNVVLEAQWAGTPVVATAAGGVAEALDPGVSGWVVDPADPARLADRVNWLLANPEMRASARCAGPRFVQARFGLKRMIDETIAAYDLAHSGAAGGTEPAAAAARAARDR
jgi:glycosyltransferase involved in cell wall biosynthesis